MAIPFATSLTPQTACKASSRRVAAKSGACCVALLGFVDRTTTFVARLAIIRILLATRSTEDLFSGSLMPVMPDSGSSNKAYSCL